MNTTQGAQPGLKPRPLDLESSALTMRPPPLHKQEQSQNNLFFTPCVCQTLAGLAVFLKHILIFFPVANTSSTTIDLMGVVRDLVFTAIVPVLFGDGILPHNQQDIKHFQEQFVQFDSSFEHGAKLPEFLLKEWAKSKHFLLGRFYEVIQKKSGTNLKEDTLLQALVDSLEGDCAPNYATLLLWASLANAVPITFWTLAFVLSDQSIKKAVQKEVDEILGPYIDRGEQEMTAFQLVSY